MRKLENLKPERVFYYFEELSKIPRASGNEKQVSDFLVNFGKSLGYKTYQDEHYNVIITRPASEGYENHPGIILQGHMDMVCEKEKGNNHDFTKDPIDLVIDGNNLRANGTTLGGDNGIAIAMSMAILEDKNIKCGQIEMLATTSEETDLGGAMALAPGLLTGKLLINIDSEDEGVVTVGSAGGVNMDVTIPVTKQKINGKFIYDIEISGLQGGHSGVEINQKRENANKILGKFLNTLATKNTYEIANIEGGSKDNAIPREAKTIIVSNEDISKNITQILDAVKEKYKATEPNIHTDVKMEKDKEILVISSANQKAYLETITNLPTGVNTWMKEYPEIVESSDNLAIIRTKDTSIVIVMSLRSSEPKVLVELQDKIKDVLSKNNLTYELLAGYPEWRYKEKSLLRDKALDIYKKMYHKDMVVEVIHAGLECGAILHNYPNLDCISVGPNLKDVHTPQEHLEIDSTERVYDYVVALIESL